MWHFAVSFLVLCVLACGCGADSGTANAADVGVHGRVVAVGDGDSLTIAVDGDEIEIRLAQIDAPELAQPYGYAARSALAGLVARRSVVFEVIDTDPYGRSVSEVFVDGVHVNRELVRGGHAWAYTRFARSPHVGELEAEARAERRGLWALAAGDRVPPWEWRRRHGTRSESGPRAPAAVEPTGPFSCGSARYCSEMTSCAQARFHLEHCGAKLDGDGDGIPCERLCRPR